jgi:hypothetical protein
MTGMSGATALPIEFDAGQRSSSANRSANVRKMLACKQFRPVLLVEWTYSKPALFLYLLWC